MHSESVPNEIRGPEEQDFLEKQHLFPHVSQENSLDRESRHVVSDHGRTQDLIQGAEYERGLNEPIPAPRLEHIGGLLSDSSFLNAPLNALSDNPQNLHVDMSANITTTNLRGGGMV